ncbi:MAG TPA: radical SAM protein [Thermoanaerobaculia bacterium]
MSSLGWHHLTRDDKRELLERIRTGRAGRGPLHVEIHPSDRCNIDCFFCSTATLRGTDEVQLRTFEDLARELRAAGTRSVRLAGGGEPLFHRQIGKLLDVLASENLPVENITTNGVLLLEKLFEPLMRSCDEITLSLNTADADSYSEMMRTPGKNFERVVQNATKLIAERDRRGAKRPKIVVQYLVWKRNFRTIERMYDLAREINADEITFNGLSHLPPEQWMSEAETDEMMSLYRKVVERDEYRKIDVISSFEQDLRPRVAAMNAELHRERSSRSFVMRARRFFSGNDFTLGQKLRHHLRVRRSRAVERAVNGFADPCLIGWYSMVVRTSGEVGPCCILQGKPIGNVYSQSLHEVWNGEPYEAFRRDLHRIMRQGAAWEASADDRFVEGLCGGRTLNCPISNFYFRTDVAFMREFQETLASL